MQKYIGTKLIEAEPALRTAGGTILPHDYPVRCDELAEDGYRVCYPDGYVSFSPKAVFEKAYMPLTVNGDLRTEEPSISQAMVDGFIAYHRVHTLGDRTTVVRAVLRNGFEIIEASSCVSAENYDEKLGAEICMGKIKDKVWMLLGFLLATAVNGVDGKAARSKAENV